MDFIERLSGTRFQHVSPSSFLKFTPLDPRVQKHLQKVYSTLALALLVCTVGCYLDIAFNIAGILTYFGALGCLIGLGFTQSIPSTLNKRYGLLAGFSFCQGASLGPLIRLALSVNPAVVFTAFAATATIFVCFSAAALLTQRRSFLFLGGWLSSVISGMMVMRLVSWLFGARALVFQAELTLGLLVFAGYVIFDSQMIVEKAYAGYDDHVKAALDLLVDVLAIFVRVIVILLRNQEKSRERERSRKRN